MVSGASRHSDHGASTEPAEVTSRTAIEAAIAHRHFPLEPTGTPPFRVFFFPSMDFLGLAPSSGAGLAKGVAACRVCGMEALHGRQHHDG